MEKKQYISPAMEMIVVEMVTMMATSGLGFDTEHEGGYEQLGNGRRGVWGDRWNNN